MKTQQQLLPQSSEATDTTTLKEIATDYIKTTDVLNQAFGIMAGHGYTIMCPYCGEPDWLGSITMHSNGTYTHNVSCKCRHKCGDLEKQIERRAHYNDMR
jgi:hypothetical protein